MLSKQNRFVKIVYDKGYRVIDNILYNPKGKKLSVSFDNKGYYRHTFSFNKEFCPLGIHKLVAYQKYGDKIFENGIEVRHLDGNKSNIFENNIVIGTHSENLFDIPKEQRIANARKGGEKIRRFTDFEVSEIRKDRNNGMTYKQLCKKYNTSKATLSYLFNKALY